MSKSARNTTATSPNRLPYYLAYLSLSLLGLYLMRLSPQLEPLNKHAESILSSPHPVHPSNHSVTIRKNYITSLLPFTAASDNSVIKGIDDFLGLLVAVFMPGALGWDKNVMLQQSVFLLQWTGMLTVMSVESVRKGNRWSLLAFPSLWALFYQTVAGAFIAPLYVLLFVYRQNKSNTSTGSASSSTTSTAHSDNNYITPAWYSTLLPSILAGYIIPTLKIYFPHKNIYDHMGWIAIWQISPILVNLIWFTLSSLYGVTMSSAPIPPRSRLIRHLKDVYLLSMLITALSHLYTITYPTIFGNYEGSGVSLYKIFVPYGMKEGSFILSGHYVFQVDYWIIFISTTIWCFQTIRQLSSTKDISTLILFSYVVGGSVLLGPGTVIAATWYWRENKIHHPVGSGSKLKIK